jgi:hypothetical protein
MYPADIELPYPISVPAAPLYRFRIVIVPAVPVFVAANPNSTLHIGNSIPAGIVGAHTLTSDVVPVLDTAAAITNGR